MYDYFEVGKLPPRKILLAKEADFEHIGLILLMVSPSDPLGPIFEEIVADGNMVLGSLVGKGPGAEFSSANVPDFSIVEHLAEASDDMLLDSGTMLVPEPIGVAARRRQALMASRRTNIVRSSAVPGRIQQLAPSSDDASDLRSSRRRRRRRESEDQADQIDSVVSSDLFRIQDDEVEVEDSNEPDEDNLDDDEDEEEEDEGSFGSSSSPSSMMATTN